MWKLDNVPTLSLAYLARPLTNQEKYRDAEDCWYLPHYAVNKIRVVFNCEARQHGTSLKEQLLPGPDLLNSFIGVHSF